MHDSVRKLSMRVSVRNISNACVSRKMRESGKVWKVLVVLSNFLLEETERKPQFLGC